MDESEVVKGPQIDQRVRVQERPSLVGTVVEVVSPTYVFIKFDNIEDPVGVAAERLVLHP